MKNTVVSERVQIRPSTDTCSIDRDIQLSRLPLSGGVCLKPQHYDDILQQLPSVGWFEIHAENYLGAGGAPLYYLEKIRQNYPLSIHGVGMSIGSADGLDQNHLERVAALVNRFDPESFSEHLAWSTHDNEYFSDLLPVPYNQSVEDTVCEHIDIVQSTLKRQMLLENPSNYLSLKDSTVSEVEFLANVLKRTGCGLLLDVNNVYVSAINCGYSASEYINSLPLDSVGEIHLAGHSEDTTDPDEPLLIDAHDREVCNEVWSLLDFTLQLAGLRPTLIEWDNSVPDFPTLLAEMKKADLVAERSQSVVDAAAR